MTDENEEFLPREVGVETRPCPICGTALAVQDNPDGSQSTVACPDCFPEPEKAAADNVIEREHGVLLDPVLDGEEDDDGEG